MIKLSEFNKLKIKGYANLCKEKYEDAIALFQSALIIKDDAQIYELIAKCYVYLKEYKLASEYALRAVELGNEESFTLFTEVTMGCLRDIEAALKALNNGANNRSSTACLMLADIYSGRYPMEFTNNEDIFQCSHFLEEAYKYCPDHKKGNMAYAIAKRYQYLSRIGLTLFRERTLFFFKEAEKYKIYGNSVRDDVFKVAAQNEETLEEQTIDVLFNNVDGFSCLVFGLWLMYSENESRISIDSDAFSLFKEGLKAKNGACALICGLEFGAFDATKFNKTKALRFISLAKSKKVLIPAYFESLFETILEDYDTELYKNVFDMPWIYYR